MQFTGEIDSLEAKMIGLEDRFRRFQDFGLLIGVAIAIAIIGALLRFAFNGNRQYLFVVRSVFYLALAWNAIGLRHCTHLESPVAGYHSRTKREIVLGIIVVFVTTVLGGIGFELTP